MPDAPPALPLIFDAQPDSNPVHSIYAALVLSRASAKYCNPKNSEFSIILSYAASMVIACPFAMIGVQRNWFPVINNLNPKVDIPLFATNANPLQLYHSPRATILPLGLTVIPDVVICTLGITVTHKA